MFEKSRLHGLNSGFTLLFEVHILELCANLGNTLIKHSPLEDCSGVTTIGIDETSRRKA